MKIVRVSLSLLLLLTLGASLAAQDAAGDPLAGFRSKLYVFASGGKVSGSLFPSRFDKINDHSGMLAAESKSSGKTGDLGFGLGFQNITGHFLAGFEASYFKAAFADAVEIEHFRGWNDQWQMIETETPFAQTGRKLTVIELGFDGGYLPSLKFPVAFLVSLGAGYHKKQFRSAYIAQLPSDFLMDTTVNDYYGDPGSGGSFSKSGLALMVGAGVKVFLLKRVSLDVRYKYYNGSRKTTSVVGGGGGNIVKSTTNAGYSVGSRLSAGLSVYF
jgi:opacity protein-like surface antigen